MYSLPLLSIRTFQIADQDEVQELILEGLAERWGEAFDPSFNQDLRDIGHYYLVQNKAIILLTEKTSQLQQKWQRGPAEHADSTLSPRSLCQDAQAGQQPHQQQQQQSQQSQQSQQQHHHIQQLPSADNQHTTTKVNANIEIVATGILIHLPSIDEFGSRDEACAEVEQPYLDQGLSLGRILRVSVRRDCRQQGLARKIVLALIQQAKEIKMDVLVGETETAWQSALALYQSCGFRVVLEKDGCTHFALDLDMVGEK